MDQAGKERARDYTLRAMSDRGLDAAGLADTAQLDPSTVRTFLAAETYPQTRKRAAIEQALGLPSGSIELAARGLVEEDVDPVERAVEASRLTRGNKHKLIGTYYDMLEEQERRGVG